MLIDCESRIIHLACNYEGIILNIISDSSGLLNGRVKPSTLEEFMPASSKCRYREFLDNLKSRRFGVCQSIYIQNGNHDMYCSLFGLFNGDTIQLLVIFLPKHLYLAADGFVQMLNEHILHFRKAHEELSLQKNIQVERERMLDEYMAVNNEFVKKERELAKKNKQLQKAYASIEQLSVTDPLTGIANRRKILDILYEEICRSNRYNFPLTVMSLDIDYFKKINDTHGHAAGDLALISFAKSCVTQLRKSDTIGRVGGEEFIIILPHTDAFQAMIIAERIRASTFALTIKHENDAVHFTVSIGIAALTPGEEMDSLLRRVDGALYQAKESGRDRTFYAQYF